MSRPGISGDFVLAPPGIAAGAFVHFEEHKIVKAAFVEMPRGRKSRDAAAHNYDGNLQSSFCRRKRSAIAELMSKLVPIVDEGAGNGAIGFWRQADESGAEKSAAGKLQCVISRQSCS